MNTPRTPSSKDREQTRSHVPASSSSSVGTASLVNNGPSGAALPTLASLLKTHASAQNPMQAAAEAALADRNVLDTQNKQLWKLIEKQRLAYNQMSKDLDRIRAERDALKAKLASGTSPTEKMVRPSTSSSAIQQVSRTSTDEGVPQRPRTIRHQSDGNDLSSSSRQPPPTPSRRTSNGLAPTPAQGESLPSVSSSPNIPAPSSTVEFPVGSRTRQNTVPGANGSSKVESAKPSLLAPRQPITIPVPPPSAPAQLLPTPLEDSHNRASRESRISLPDEAKMYIMNGSPLPSPNPANTSYPNGLSPGHSATNSARSSHDPGPSSSSILNGVSPVSPRPRSALPNTTGTPKSPTTIPNHTKSASDVRDIASPAHFVESPSHHYTFSQKTDASSTLVDTESEVTDITDDQDDGRRWNRAEDKDVINARTPAPPQPSRQLIRDVESNESMKTPLQSRPKYPQQEDRNDEDSSIPSMLHSLQPRLRIGTDALEQSKQKLSPFGDPISSTTSSSPSFRALPLLSTDLPHTKVAVPSSSVRFNDRGKEVLSFLVVIDPGKGKEKWQVEKLYSDVLGLDQRMRNMVGRSLGKKMGVLPEGKLWRHDAPAKIDQRKAALETYLQSLINLPVKNKDEVIAFFTSDIVRDTKKPVMQAGYKEGYLTKRGQKLGGWKTRYFVVHGPVLDYYENRGGAHLGSINITGAQIGRQTKTDEEENDYRHAFLIMEPKRGGSPTRHVLCAESDPERDAWIDVLLKYVRGTFIDEPSSAVSLLDPGIPRTSISSVSSTSLAIDNVNTTPSSSRAGRSGEFDTPGQGRRGISPGKQDSGYSVQSGSNPAYSDADTARRLLDRNQVQNDAAFSSSLPTSSPLDGGPVVTRSSSEQGHYLDPSVTQTPTRANHISPERERHWFRDRKTGTPSSLNVGNHNTPGSADTGNSATETSLQTPRAKISAPMGVTVLPSGYKFGAASSPAEPAVPSSNDKRDKAKTRNFWAFGKNNGDKAAITFTNRDVFGVTIEESLEVASIANLPAVVFRCIQFLEAKKADQEEGIYRLSGSSAVIKALKDRFNTESDINLLESEEYWDPHAIAGLLKSFLRDLPTSILTRELHLRFLSVIDFVDAQERVQELANLISALPLPNYSLLRALTAHLILIVQNANVNKMTMRNVGIVFSPTLGIPAGVFSLMLGEFNRVFNVDEGEEPWDGKVVGPGEPVPLDAARLAWRNSRQYSDAAADHLLGIAGRTLSIPESDGETASSEYESEAESVNTVESDEATFVHPPTPKSKASHHVAASRGLNIEVSQSSRGNRHSRILGGVELPPSPRPLVSPSQPNHVSTR